MDDLLDNEPCNSKIHEFLIYETDKTDYEAKGCSLIDRPEDYKYADLTKNELKDLDWINWSDFFLVSKEMYMGKWIELAWLLSSGDMKDVAMDMEWGAFWLACRI